MRTLTKPIETAEEVFIECIKIVRDNHLKARLIACKDLIQEAADEFDEKVTKGELQTIVRETTINGNVNAKELEDVYTYRMAKKDTPGRKIYDKMFIAPPLGICPLCSHRVVKTLDHYLPKALYPRLSVVPINLVPSCSDCNKSMLTAYPTLPEEETLHPYYDDIENEIWLKAVVIELNPPYVNFDTINIIHWSELLNKRVKYHFDILELNNLYSIHAAVELGQIEFRLSSIHKSIGAEGVRSHLLEAAETRSHQNRNSWQAALYTAIADNHWFCNGGFRHD